MPEGCPDPTVEVITAVLPINNRELARATISCKFRARSSCGAPARSGGSGETGRGAIVAT